MNIYKSNDSQIWSMFVSMESNDFLEHSPKHLKTLEDICIDYTDDIENIFGIEITHDERYFIHQCMLKYLKQRHDGKV